MYSHFNAQHWAKVKLQRRQQGLNRLEETDRVVAHHHLTGQTLRQTPTGELWTVVSVRQDWNLGRYLVATLASAGKTLTLAVETLSSDARDVLQEVAQFQDDFELVH